MRSIAKTWMPKRFRFVWRTCEFNKQLQMIYINDNSSPLHMDVPTWNSDLEGCSISPSLTVLMLSCKISPREWKSWGQRHFNSRWAHNSLVMCWCLVPAASFHIDVEERRFSHFTDILPGIEKETGERVWEWEIESQNIDRIIRTQPDEKNETGTSVGLRLCSSALDAVCPALMD